MQFEINANARDCLAILVDDTDIARNRNSGSFVWDKGMRVDRYIASIHWACRSACHDIRVERGAKIKFLLQLDQPH